MTPLHASTKRPFISSVPCNNKTATIGLRQAFSEEKRRKWRNDVTILGDFRHLFADVLSIIA